MENRRSDVQREDSARQDAPVADTVTRRRIAELVRRFADDVTRSGVQAVGYWVAPADMGPDQLSEVVGSGFRRLAEDLAFALEMSDDALLVDEVVWLTRLLHVRGYDAEKWVLMTLETFEASLAAVCPPEVLTLAGPILAAGRQAVPDTLAALRSGPGA
jgi:glutamate/tyrosine decarboxylase-like PLP-dependent enzyme